MSGELALYVFSHNSKVALYLRVRTIVATSNSSFLPKKVLGAIGYAPRTSILKNIVPETVTYTDAFETQSLPTL